MTPAGGGASPRARGAAPAPSGTASANVLWGRALLEGLVSGGVRHVVLSPGSRSSALALAARRRSGVTVHVQIDERSAAFHALGIAKATRSPVALVCTSGTAAANYLPALAEAFLSAVPVVALTADRPPELRGTGAPQTIDQIRLYGSHVRFFRDLPCPDDEGANPALAARAAREACEIAKSAPIGPVHLNVPFREPLVPEPGQMPACDMAWEALVAETRKAAEVTERAPVPRVLPGLRSLHALAARIAKAARPLIIAGPEAVEEGEAASVLAYARAARVPVFADIASGLRFAAVPEGVTLCARADLFLRDPAIARLAPDLVVRLGGIPTSKTLATWLARHRPPVIAIQPDERRRDPDGIVGEVIVAGAGAACEAMLSGVRGTVAVHEAWRAVLGTAERGVEALDDGIPAEACAVVAACGALPSGGALFLSSSMPVRWAETYVAARASAWRVLANRGANGIDGIVSTASGVARGGGRPTLLVTGDLAFLHDLGGLRSAREVKTGFVIVVLNNDGGGIFSHLPIARHEADFEPLFGTPHGCDLAMATRAMGLEHCLAGSIAEVASLVAGAFASGLVRVIEWRTERARTVREHADLARRAGVDDSRIEAAGIGWRVSRRGPRTELPVVFLHGFTGSGEFWMPVANALPRRYCIVPDLPGHGGTDAPVPAQSWRIDRASDALVALLDRLGIARFVLAGYSMGGRLALGLALRHADRVAALALVGASPGIASAEERSQRAGDDLALADSIERDGMEAFCRKWEANPLFATQERLAPELREAMRAQRRRQDPSRLAQALRAFGTGFQPPVHGELARLALPVLVVAGGEDAKYSAIAREMAGRIPGATLRIVPGAGHAVPLESAGRFAEELEGFLTRSIDA